MNNYNTIITDQTNFQLDTKLLTIHSDDRDITKWKSPALFEIELPQEYYNIQTLRLLNINFTNNEKVFSYYKKNTKFSFHIPLYEKTFTVTIEDGNYTGEELASEIQYKMNKALNDHISTISCENVCDEKHTNNENYRKIRKVCPNQPSLSMSLNIASCERILGVVSVPTFFQRHVLTHYRLTET